MFNEKFFNDQIKEYLNLKVLLNDLIIIFKHIIISSFHYPIILFVTILMLLFSIQKKNVRDYFFILFYSKFIVYYIHILTN